MANHNNDEHKDTNNDSLEESIEYKVRIENQFYSGANWFYWIAGLSVINTIAYFVGWDWTFIFGLGITQIIEGIAYELQGIERIIALTMEFLVIGGIVLLGFLAKKGFTWVFIVGMILYALDGLLFLIFEDWLGLGFHAFALYEIYKGLRANRILKKL